jgi:hypothetical protein
MTNRKAALWFAVFAVVVYASGVASGVLLHRFAAGTPGPVHVVGGPVPLRHAPNPTRLTRQLTHQLSLSGEQSARIRSILEQRRGVVRHMHRDLREQARRRFVEEQGSLRTEIRAVLNAEQQAKFDALVSRGPEGFWPGPGRFPGGGASQP